MPGQFAGCGVKLMYPENWEISEQFEGEGGEPSSVTFESPEGAFFSLARYHGITDSNHVIQRAIEAMREEYPELEVEDCGSLTSNPGEAAIQNSMIESGADLSFYYLDLLITVRLVAMVFEGDVLLVQLQGESRDFDKLEPIFGAMMHTLRQSMAN